MRVTKDPEERKAEIISTARRLFEQNGYKETQIKDIVSQIGVAQGLFYYYFKSKEEVMEAVARQYADQIMGAIREVVNRDDALMRKIDAVFNVFITAANRESKLFLEMMTAKNGEIHARIFIEIGEKLIPFVAEMIEMGNQSGECKCENPVFFSRLFVAGLFSNINQIAPEQKIEYMISESLMIKEIIKRLFDVKM